MKVILVMVASVDGKTTSWQTPSVPGWTSIEDKKHFKNIIDENNLIIMGRKTYEDSAPIINNMPGKLRVIITKNPEKYKFNEVPSQLEFTNENPPELLRRLSEAGYKQVILAGGAEINKLFIASNLIDELWLTVEPVILGKGNNLIASLKITKNMKLLSVDKLNRNGTLLLKYSLV